MDFLTSSTHVHITTWVIALILFFIALKKPSTGVHMGLRLFYVLILVTGFMLFVTFDSLNPMLYGIKMLAGIITIGLMEMTLVRKKKNKSNGGVFAGALVVLLITIILGFALPGIA
ncbi:YisL family protein [Domibacillus tundrae]|uniref:YisL family protein n=1 Tax=Domibacillus tundrae TaxID=1587527 RepID=UPI000617E616|nr:YisL family protein [Domibacillus tundrae]